MLGRGSHSQRRSLLEGRARHRCKRENWALGTPPLEQKVEQGEKEEGSGLQGLAPRVCPFDVQENNPGCIIFLKWLADRNSSQKLRLLCSGYVGR